MSVALLAACLVPVLGCRAKASRQECDALIGHFAELVVREKFQDAGPETIRREQVREHREAADEEAFRNCPSEVSRDELRCALSAPSSNAVIKCLE